MGVFSKISCDRIFSEEGRRPKFKFPFLPASIQTHISNECVLISRILSREGMNRKPECLAYRIDGGKQALRC